MSENNQILQLLQSKSSTKQEVFRITLSAFKDLTKILERKVSELSDFMDSKDQSVEIGFEAKGDFIFKLMDPIFTGSSITSYGRWELLNNETGSIVSYANQDIEVGSEKYLDQLGLNVKITQAKNPGDDPTNIPNNGLISGTIEFANINDRWLSGVADFDQVPFFWGLNWIRAGSYEDDQVAQWSDYAPGVDDPNGAFEGAVVQSNVVFGFEYSGGKRRFYGL